MNGKVIIFSAPSGSGKTTIIKQLLEKDLNMQFSVSACSRPKRPEETEGKDYYFIQAEEFKKKIAENQFVEWQEVYKDFFYGTLKSEIERLWKNKVNIVFDVDVLGGINLKKIFRDQAFSLFIKPPSLDELETRLRNRLTEDESTMRKRISRVKKELTYASQFDIVIINDCLEKAVSEAYNAIRDFISK
jgi:guanylate kinase